MISLKLSNNSEWQSLRGNKNFPRNNLHANLKLVMSPDVLWATCEMFLSQEPITLRRHVPLGGEGRLLTVLCLSGLWQCGDYRIAPFCTVNLHSIEWLHFQRNGMVASVSGWNIKYQTPVMPKAKENVRVSNINWPWSAKLKCQHNKNILWDKPSSIACAKCCHLLSWCQSFLNPASWTCTLNGSDRTMGHSVWLLQKMKKGLWKHLWSLWFEKKIITL